MVSTRIKLVHVKSPTAPKPKMIAAEHSHHSVWHRDYPFLMRSATWRYRSLYLKTFQILQLRGADVMDEEHVFYTRFSRRSDATHVVTSRRLLISCNS